MKEIKQLAGDSLIYGLGTVVPRFLNWLLVPFYTKKVFIPEEYGIVTEFYAYMMVLLIILTYGMETGYFKFVEYREDKNKVYSTTILSLFGTSLFFVGLIVLFLDPVSNALGYSQHKEYIWLVASIIAIDSFSNIPFANLRYQRKALKFSTLKIVNVSVIIAFNIIFLVVFPNIEEQYELIDKLYNPDLTVSYVFIANLLGSSITLLLLIPEITKAKFIFSWDIWKNMIRYSFPLLIAGLAGIMNEAMDRILLKHLISDSENALHQLGVYGANVKIAVLMMLFIQMFRYAFEPFFFKKGGSSDKRVLYAQIAKYFLIFALIIFLGIVFYLDIIKIFIGDKYHSGLKVVPVLLIANIFLGMFVNLSVWYKLNQLTQYGAIITALGVVITILINLLFIPQFGYMACPYARLGCYGFMFLLSFYLSRKYFPIPYEKGKMTVYFLFALLLFGIHKFLGHSMLNDSFQTVFDTFMLLIFIFVIEKKEGIIRFLFSKETKN